MGRIKYLDFELKFERCGDGYIARILSSPCGEASCAFTLPFSDEKLENLILKIGRMRRTSRVIHSSEMGAAREFGGKLFETIFRDEVGACYRRSYDEATRHYGTGLRLKLRVQEAPELTDLPWEFLFDPSFDRFLAQSDYTPIVRYIELPERVKPLSVPTMTFVPEAMLISSATSSPNTSSLPVGHGTQHPRGTFPTWRLRK